jgi:hypothetical protein
LLIWSLSHCIAPFGFLNSFLISFFASLLFYGETPHPQSVIPQKQPFLSPSHRFLSLVLDRSPHLDHSTGLPGPYSPFAATTWMPSVFSNFRQRRKRRIPRPTTVTASALGRVGRATTGSGYQPSLYVNGDINGFGLLSAPNTTRILTVLFVGRGDPALSQLIVKLGAGGFLHMISSTFCLVR